MKSLYFEEGDVFVFPFYCNVKESLALLCSHAKYSLCVFLILQLELWIVLCTGTNMSNAHDSVHSTMDFVQMAWRVVKACKIGYIQVKFFYFWISR